jgi:hypothetical protein
MLKNIKKGFQKYKRFFSFFTLILKIFIPLFTTEMYFWVSKNIRNILLNYILYVTCRKISIKLANKLWVFRDFVSFKMFILRSELYLAKFRFNFVPTSLISYEHTSCYKLMIAGLFMSWINSLVLVLLEQLVAIRPIKSVTVINLVTRW